MGPSLKIYVVQQYSLPLDKPCPQGSEIDPRVPLHFPMWHPLVGDVSTSQGSPRQTLTPFGSNVNLVCIPV